MTVVSQSAATRDVSALRSRAAWTRLGVVAGLGLLIDLVTKYLAFGHIAAAPVSLRRAEIIEATRLGRPLGDFIPPHDPVTIVPKVLDFTLVLNKGAVFGIGAGGPWVWFTLLGLGVGLWMFAAWTRSRDHAAQVAVGLLLAGGLGNLYDRVMYACVRDFIHPLPGVRMPFGWHMPLSGEREIWPYVSNVADLWLIVGIGVFMWHLWRTGGDSHRTTSASSENIGPQRGEPP